MPRTVFDFKFEQDTPETALIMPFSQQIFSRDERRISQTLTERDKQNNQAWHTAESKNSFVLTRPAEMIDFD